MKRTYKDETPDKTSSGVFIYRLKMGNFVDMKKMLFVNNSAFFNTVGFHGVRDVTNFVCKRENVMQAVVQLLQSESLSN